ncbi:hypothetical protein FB451DRAFT_1221809 [Mycena latifolia]|nr:hypothetical protein FB451DRAFT_1221809 [Mycena latifolia]
MAISASDLVTFATPSWNADVPGIFDEVRNRLEWTWGLGHGNLEDHLRGFVDPQHVLMNNALLVIPPRGAIFDLWARNSRMKLGVRRSHIQKVYKGTDSFDYLVVPIDPSNPTPPRMWVSDIPPHLAICTTDSKISKAWGHLTGRECTPMKLSVLERSRAVLAATGNPGFALDVSDFVVMEGVHSFWSQDDSVPGSFLSEDSDHTMVEVEEEPEPKFSACIVMGRKVGSSASCYREPTRRLLPSEARQDPQGAVNHRLFPSEDGDDDSDDSMSSDSHITGVEDSEEFAKASAARGDYEADRTWLKGIESWVQNAEGVDDDAMLVNDGQIEAGAKEGPRVATSMELDKPDYLSKHTLLSKHKIRTRR